MVDFDLSSIKLNAYDKKRNLTLPKESSRELAEFLGVLTGDGFMNRYSGGKTEIAIAGDSRLDLTYHNKFVIPLAKKLFNLVPKTYFIKDKNAINSKLCSKGLFEYLLLLGFKRGKKGRKLGIPNWILNNPVYMLNFIRGLSDTDGSLSLIDKHQKKYNFYPRITFCSISKILIFLVRSWLIKKGFKTSVIYDAKEYDKRTNTYSIKSDLYLNGRNNLEKWMNLVSFRNSRHLRKYEFYLKYNDKKKVGEIKWNDMGLAGVAPAVSRELI